MFTKHRGVSLIELMVAITLALILTLAVGLIYVNNRQTNRLQDENSAIQENGRLALEILGRHFREAAYVDVSPTNILRAIDAAPLRVAGAGVPAVMGCNGALFSGSLSPPWSCGASSVGDPDSITIAYQAQRLPTPPNPRDLGGALPIAAGGAEGVDCLGQGTQGGGADPSSPLAINRIWVNRTERRLYCHGNGNTTPQALLQGIEDLQIRYGLGENEDERAAQYVLTTGNWNAVRAIELCVLAVSEGDNVTTERQRYIDCNDNAVTSSDRRKRQAFRAVVTIRGRVSPMPTYPAS